MPLLGLQPVVGRSFADGEDKPARRARRDDQRGAVAAALRRRSRASSAGRSTVNGDRLHGRRHRAAGADGADERRHVGAAGDRSAEGDPAESRAVRRRPPEARRRRTARRRPRWTSIASARAAAVSRDEGLGRQPGHLHRHLRQRAAADRAARAARRGRCSCC